MGNGGRPRFVMEAGRGGKRLKEAREAKNVEN